MIKLLLPSIVLATAFATRAWAETQSVAATQPSAAPDAWRPITLNLESSQRAIDMLGCQKTGVSLHLNGMHMVDAKPAAITKEPAYLGKPWYGAFRVGNGPKSVTYLAIDQCPDQPEKLYVDTNQNGDLTDDGPGTWDGSMPSTKDETVYNSTIELHASYGTPLIETESGSYSYYLSKVRGEPKFGYYKTTVRVGKLPLDGKDYTVWLDDTTADAIFSVPAKMDRSRFPVGFYIDLDGDGTFKGIQKMVDGKSQFTAEQFATDEPVHINDHWFYVRPNLSGSNVTLIPAVAADPAAQMAAAADPFDSRSIVKNGVVAPDFNAVSESGGSINLSDFKGKIVLLDFWATWCGPCQASMPGLEKVYQQIKDQGVVVLSVNVLDEKPNFDDWIKVHSGKDYHFTFAFDPAGKDDDNHKSIATKTYGVVGIPTMFVVDREGKVFAGLEGQADTDRLKIALRGLGVKVN